jgi:hypothetical protein
MEVATYAAVTATSIAALLLLAGFLRLDVPFAYSDDALFTGAAIKNMIQNGWYLVNPSLGAPGVSNLADFPMTDIGSFAIMKAMSWLNGDWAVVVNAFYLLGFPLSAVAALWSLRSLGIGRLPAAAAALLFAFLPLHFERGELHLLLSFYYVVPLAALVALWVMSAEPPRFGRSAGRFWMDRKAVISLVVAVAVSLDGVYYAFFTCFFILVAAILGAVRHDARRSLTAAGIAIVTVLVVSVVSLTPSLAYWAGSGQNTGSYAAQRRPIQAVALGLKLDALLLPVEGHRWPLMADARTGYLSEIPSYLGGTWDNEASRSAGIGIVAGVGFFGLLGWLFVGSMPWVSRLLGEQRRLVAHLAALNIAGVLLATVSGVGSLLARVLPQIRAYNRISVYLAFFALAGVAVMIEAVAARADRRWGTWAGVSLVVAVALLGMLDQIPAPNEAAVSATSAQYEGDGRFVTSIEKELGPGRSVFQLPVVTYPEAAVRHLRGYLHSRDTKWSFGAVLGRPTASWQEQVAQLPLAQMVPELKRAGFAGLWVDRTGYPDGGAAIVGNAQQVLRTKPIEDETGEFVFFLIK